MPFDVFNPTAPRRRRRVSYTLTVTIDGAQSTRTLDRVGNAAAEIESVYYATTETPLTPRDEHALDYWDSRRPLHLTDAALTATVTTVTR